ncbi:rCG45852 [Rattus norvegicus]|uniref:RCG45852 n=1 Tax=Rattus norvegicus TaxID=10116 RepID=A6JUB3_RAT|nr:rCG45852 [Rattus norvegicus]
MLAASDVCCRIRSGLFPPEQRRRRRTAGTAGIGKKNKTGRDPGSSYPRDMQLLSPNLVSDSFPLGPCNLTRQRPDPSRAGV